MLTSAVDGTLQKQGSERWREIEHIQIWVRRNFSHVLTWSIKAWVAGRAGSYRQKETGALCCFALRRPPKLTISGERERRPKMKKSAAVLTYLLRHSSEIRGLCLMKLSSESPQNLPYLSPEINLPGDLLFLLFLAEAFCHSAFSFLV